MVQGYRDFVTREANHRSIGRLLRDMAGEDRPELFHCASGKDRTGWIAALLHHIAGVDRDTMLADFLDAALDQVCLTYGDLDGYLDGALHLEAEVLAALRNRLTT